MLRRERPDALLPTMGGQTALNVARALEEAGILAELGIELIGARAEVIDRAEDRLLFKRAVESCGLQVAGVDHRHRPRAGRRPGVPAVVRPAFTLGGHGGGFVTTRNPSPPPGGDRFAPEPDRPGLVEESLSGWDEFELEVVRDLPTTW